MLVCQIIRYNILDYEKTKATLLILILFVLFSLLIFTINIMKEKKLKEDKPEPIIMKNGEMNKSLNKDTGREIPRAYYSPALIKESEIDSLKKAR